MAHERTYAQHDPTWNDGSTDPTGPPAAPGATPPRVTLPGVDVQWTPDGETVGVATGWLTGETYDDAESDHDRVTRPYYVWLTRSEVNRLVRNLRRARGSAFGVDE